LIQHKIIGKQTGDATCSPAPDAVTAIASVVQAHRKAFAQALEQQQGSRSVTGCETCWRYRIDAGLIRE
jgi:hypothetical protein